MWLIVPSRCNQVNMRSYWFEWVLIQWRVSILKEGNLDIETGGDPVETGRDWSDAAASRGTPRIAYSHYNARKKHGGTLPGTLWRKTAQPTGSSIADFQFPSCERIKYCFYATKLLVICCGSPKKRIDLNEQYKIHNRQREGEKEGNWGRTMLDKAVIVRVNEAFLNALEA